MKAFAGAVAVITGAASGIGFACAAEAVRRGMRVVLADVRPDALEAAARALADTNADADADADVVPVVTDVSRESDLARLATVAHERFGGTNLLINNAGVFASGVTWEVSPEQFAWVVRTNLLSVHAGIHAFVPGMIASGAECHVVNVASGAGLLTFPGYCSYSSTKHAVVALTEALHYDLVTHGVAHVGTTVVMPGPVRTDVMNPAKTAAPGLADELARRLDDPVNDGTEQVMRVAVDDGMPPTDVALEIFAAIERGEVYLRPNLDGALGMCRALADARLTGSTPP